MSSQEGLYPSVKFGQTEALFVYNTARSLDSPTRSDRPISVLAEDAVRTAIRFGEETEPMDHIDIGLAIVGLMAALEGNVEPQL